MMRAVGLKTLKNRLSEYVRIAAGGETVLITDRDRVVAELSPPAQGRAQRLNDAALAELVRQGVITPAVSGPGPRPARRPVARYAHLARELESDRADR